MYGCMGRCVFVVVCGYGWCVLVVGYGWVGEFVNG